MPIKTSGALALIADIEAEFSQGDDNISLAQAGVDAGLNAGDLGMFEFYGLSDAVAPTVSTDSTASVNTVQMRVYGTVSSDGGGTITERGFYFGTSSNYASNTKYSVGGTTGGFNRLFTGLNSNTTYYYTAYAINSSGETRGTTKSQATAFNYTFKRGEVMALSGAPGTTLYYYGVAGNWIVRQGINNQDVAYTCPYFCTNRQNRYYDTTNQGGQYLTFKQPNAYTGCNNSYANYPTFGSFSIVVGANFSNQSSNTNWRINRTSSGLDIRWTST
jgi:hypothetical protein